jgi:hypothetical protein
MPFRRLRPSPLALALIAVCAAAHGGEVVERTVAFVNKKPVLLSDVVLTRALLELDENEAIERSIDEVLMYEEASRLVTDPPSEEAVANAVKALVEKAGTAFSPAALHRKAQTQLTISQYIELRLRPLVRIDDDEVRRKFNERAASDPLAPAFSLVAPSIRETLERRALDEKIEEWVASLRRREGVRRVAPRRP